MRITKTRGAIAALLIVVLVAVGLSASLAFGDSHRGSAVSVGLRAKLQTRAKGTASGMFVATLRGQSLRWSLAYKKPGAARLSALIRAKNGRAAKLCSSCGRLVRGSLRLSPAVARAATRGKARVELRVRAAAAPSLLGPITVEQVPVLTITSPKAGQTVHLPTQVSYSTGSIEVRQDSGMQLEVYVANQDGTHVRIPLAESSGTVTLPDVKSAYLVGHRNLTFRLLDAEGVPLPNPEAAVVVRDLTIEGTKGG
jgi:hypothetical protein